MTPQELLKSGDLLGTLEEVQNIVRKQPADSAQRVFLFQLLVLLGQWKRALNQLDVLHDLDDGTIAMVVMYRDVIQCEALREQVFRGTKVPLMFGDPEPWSALMIQAQTLTGKGEHSMAGELRAQALEQAPAEPGEIDGQAFAWIADADTRLGPILEVIMEGRYFWVPFHRIQSVSIAPPEDLRDLAWLPAQFTWANGGESPGLIPTRYPFSYEQEDPQLALCRKTVWQELGEQDYIGAGQRLLATDNGEYAIMDVREISMSS